MAEQAAPAQADEEKKRAEANAELADKWLKAIAGRRDVEKKWRTERAPEVVKR